MKIEYLKTVLAVAQLRSLKRAAAQIPCSCSTVTKQIQAVEEELQTELFVRYAHNRDVVLTEAGVRGLEYIQSIVSQYDKLERAVKPRASMSKTNITMSVDGNLMGSVAISNLLSECYQAHPEYQITIFREDYVHGKELLRAGKRDVMLGMWHQWEGDSREYALEGDLAGVYIGTVPVSVVAGKQNPRITKDSYTLWELKTEKFLFGISLSDMHKEKQMDSYYQVNGNFLKACMMRDFVPSIEKVDVLIQDTNLADIKAALLVKNKGVSLAVLPAGLRDNDRLKYAVISDMPYHIRYDLIYRRDRGEAEIKVLGEFIRTLFA